jgi:hypothetical protein
MMSAILRLPGLVVLAHGAAPSAVVTIPHSGAALDGQAQAWIPAMLSLVRTLWAEKLLIALVVAAGSDAMLQEQLRYRRHVRSSRPGVAGDWTAHTARSIALD